MESYPIYPAKLEALESAAVRQRRKVLNPKLPESDSKQLPADTVGLALSGGGIRSATFCLGILQAFAKSRLLREIDMLSTVSGGGYIGSFLGRFYDRLRCSPVPPPALVEGALSDPQSPEVQWLRRHGNYIAPSGKTDLNVNLATVLRNMLTLQFIIMVLLFTLAGLANAFRYGVLDYGAGLLPYIGSLQWNDLPLGYLVSQSGLEVFWSPWFMAFELVLLLFALPHGIGYWLMSPDDPEEYNFPTLLALFGLIIVILVVGTANPPSLTVLLGVLPFVISLFVVEITWWRVRKQNAATGTGGPSVQRLRGRNYLTRELALWIGFAVSIFGLALVDTAGHAIFERYINKTQSYAEAFLHLGAALAAVLPFLHLLARFISNRQSKRQPETAFTRLFTHPAVGALLGTLLLAPPLIVVFFASHAAYGGGQNFRNGVLWTLAAAGLTAIFALPKAVPFINRSSLNQTYAARIARAYLGASNPLRYGSRGTVGSRIDEVVPGDDTDSLQEYQPYAGGGPFHIIGTCVNETIDAVTQGEVRDRQGNSLAVSSVGLSVGRHWHALWEGASAVQPVGHLLGTPHPLIDAAGHPARALETLQLRNWISISGAAFGSGMGQHTNRALSVLFTAVNLRTGYWWDSGISSAHHGLRPAVTFVRRLIWLLPRFFFTQSCLLDEALARFPGPWARFWYLSDGGHFENLGIYELVRRRIPFMIAIDSVADPKYDFKDFGNFERKVRIDFGVELVPYSEQDWKRSKEQFRRDLQARGLADDVVDQKLTQWSNYFEPIWEQIYSGRPDSTVKEELTPTFDEDGSVVVTAKKCAALYRVVYDRGEQSSLLLYIKASATADDPMDVKNYRIQNPEFPHQSTADQFFDESQWESYRMLGEHIGSKVLASSASVEGFGSGLWLTLLK